MTIYDDMQGVAADLLAEFNQGTIVYVEMVPGVGGTPDEPAEPTPTPHPVNAVTRPVEFKYVDGTNIVQSDEQFTMPGNGVVPSIEGYATLDGTTCKIIGIKRIPATGVAITYTVIVRR